MKTILRAIAFNSLALFLISVIFTGVKIQGGLPTLLLGATIFSLISFLLKPILGIISLPFNLITFGLFSFLTNALILYVFTVFMPPISIQAFTIKQISFSGFIIPTIKLNTFFAFIFVSLGLSVIISFLKWLTE